jgi:hypothetical protein
MSPDITQNETQWRVRIATSDDAARLVEMRLALEDHLIRSNPA